MGESLGQAVLDLRTNLGNYNRNIDQAGQKAQSLDRKFKATSATLKKLGGNLQSAGVKFTAFVTAPIVGLGALAVKLADVQIQAEAGLAAALTFTGQEAARILPDLKAFASGLQDVTTVGDETTLKMLQVATSMGLTAEGAKDAVKEAIGLSKAFGIAETTAIRMTASLQDGDTTMLNRYIPALKSVEDEAERVALAHKLLAGAFEVAVAEAENGLGPWKQLGNLYGDLLEDLGAIILEGLEPLVGILKAGVEWLQSMSDSTKRWIVTILAIAAAIGPVLVALGTFLVVLGSLAGMLASGGAIAVGAGLLTTAVATMAPFLATAALALGVFWAAWKVGEFLADLLGIQENALAGWLDAMGFFGPSIQEIIADTNESAVAFGTYRTAAEIAADETERLARIQAEELAAALETTTPLVVTITDELAKMGEEAAAAATLIEKEQIEAIRSLGFTIENDALQQLADLSTAWASGKVPAGQMIEAVRDLDVKFAEMGILTPAVAAELALLRAEMRRGGAAFLTLAEKADAAKRAIDSFNSSFKDADDVTVEFAEVSLPAVVPELDKMSDSARQAADSLSGFFQRILGGIPVIGSLGGALGKGIDKLAEWTGKLKDKLTSGLSSLFGEGSKIGSFLSDGLGQVIGFAIPLLGPMIAPLIGKLAGILGKGLKKMWAGIKSIFGGPSGAEIAGREAAAEFRDMIRSELSAEVLADVKLQFPNQVQNAAFLASIQQKLIAAGVAAEAAGAQAREWGIRLFEAEKKGGDAVQGVIDQIRAATEAATAATAITQADIVTRLAEMKQEYADTFRSITKEVGLSTAERKAMLAQLTLEHQAAMSNMLGQQKTAMAEITAVSSTGFQKVSSAISSTASIAIGAARATEKAWVKSATNTTAAWRATRASTVGFSSILDIQVIGSAAAHQLGDDQVAAAHKTGAVWDEVSTQLVIDPPGGAGGGGAAGAHGHSQRVLEFAAGGGARGGGRDGNAVTMTANLFLSRSGRELLATDVIKLTPAMLRKLGLL